ncbi:unnamed protein product [Pelagomonas calceolata]|uniref:protein-serine/threonine phosphatase n=1 Tax=Pelagomonas calceolata TaxID=35677 RepID=A0A7S3ZR16_9STRA|nr:unnamed protein product [Pelagomonas calceolata]|mmetsp:Transcript_0/g.1  ORF Transcript_0/g.1 Transcript_0/m.1 type:complete len:360 (-) Transcript_0:2-1081(-)
MGRRGKAIGAAAKKSRRHLDTMQAKQKKPPPVARGECLTLPVDDDLTSIEAADLPSLLPTATVVDASRTKGYLLDSVHVPQHEWDFLTPEARKLCEANRKLIFLDVRSARAVRREYPNLDVAVVRGGFDACLAALPSNLFRGVDEERRLEPYCLYLKDRRHLDWAAGLDDDERGAEVRRMHRLPVDVTPNLYLGDAGCAADMERLKSLSITHVLNCAAGETRDMSAVYLQHGIRSMAVAAKDNENCALLDGHVDVEAFLSKARTSGRVLVHCVQGLNRSGLVVAAALVRDGVSVIDAVRTLRARRGNDALSNTNFQRRLVRYAARLGRLGPVPDVVVSEARPAAPAPAPPPTGGCCLVS